MNHCFALHILGQLECLFGFLSVQRAERHAHLQAAAVNGADSKPGVEFMIALNSDAYYAGVKEIPVCLTSLVAPVA